MEIVTSIKGIYRDILKGKDGNLIYDSGWVTNTIMDRCRILLSGFMKNDPSYGIQRLAVGRGLKQWDTTGAPSPDPATTTNLVDRFNPPIPYADLNLVYLDEDDTVVVGQRKTDRLQVTATLVPGYPTPVSPLTSYPLREFGLFGKFNDEEYMINYIRHPVIHKDESATLIRLIKLYF